MAGQFGGNSDYLFTINDREALRNRQRPKQAMCRVLQSPYRVEPLDFPAKTAAVELIAMGNPCSTLAKD
jgi:hypothetical protein